MEAAQQLEVSQGCWLLQPASLLGGDKEGTGLPRAPAQAELAVGPRSLFLGSSCLSKATPRSPSDDTAEHHWIDRTFWPLLCARGRRAAAGVVTSPPQGPCGALLQRRVLPPRAPHKPKSACTAGARDALSCQSDYGPCRKACVLRDPQCLLPQDTVYL